MHRYRSRDSHETPDALNSYHNYNENKAVVYILFSWLLFTYNGTVSDPNGMHEVSTGPAQTGTDCVRICIRSGSLTALAGSAE